MNPIDEDTSQGGGSSPVQKYNYFYVKE